MASCESGDGDVVFQCVGGTLYICASRQRTDVVLNGLSRSFRITALGFARAGASCVFTHDRRFKGGLDDPEGPIMTVIGE